MKLILLFLAMAMAVQAAPAKRPIKKATTTTSWFAPAGANAPLPMKGSCKVIPDTGYGKMEFTAEVMQPVGKSVLFECQDALNPGTWVTLAWFGPYTVSQPVFAQMTSNNESVFIRATCAMVPAVVVAARSRSASPTVKVNKAVRGADAWRGKR